MKPTEEQQAIIDYALTGDNLIVQAYAGRVHIKRLKKSLLDCQDGL